MDKKTFLILIIKRMKMMLKNFLPFNVFGIAPILKKSHWMEDHKYSVSLMHG
jgi:hypothetical protein